MRASPGASLTLAGLGAGGGEEARVVLLRVFSIPPVRGLRRDRSPRAL